MHQESDTCLTIGKWGEVYAQLASPTFWEYQPSIAKWTQGPTRTLAQPQGEVTPPASTTPEIFSHPLAHNATILKPETKKSKQNDKKLDFISLKKTIKMAQSLDTSVLIAVVRPIMNEDMPKKNKKIQDQDSCWRSTWNDTRRETPDVEGIRSRKGYNSSKGYDEGNGGEGGSCGKGEIVQGLRGVWGHIPGKVTLWTTSKEADRS